MLDISVQRSHRATPDRRSVDGSQAAGGTAVVAGGCGILPMPRGIGETTYTTAPITMIDSTLMTQSRMVIAVASASGML